MHLVTCTNYVCTRLAMLHGCIHSDKAIKKLIIWNSVETVRDIISVYKIYCKSYDDSEKNEEFLKWKMYILFLPFVILEPDYDSDITYIFIYIQFSVSLEQFQSPKFETFSVYSENSNNSARKFYIMKKNN